MKFFKCSRIRRDVSETIGCALRNAFDCALEDAFGCALRNANLAPNTGYYLL